MVRIVDLDRGRQCLRARISHGAPAANAGDNQENGARAFSHGLAPVVGMPQTASHEPGMVQTDHCRLRYISAEVGRSLSRLTITPIRFGLPAVAQRLPIPCIVYPICRCPPRMAVSFLCHVCLV